MSHYLNLIFFTVSGLTGAKICVRALCGSFLNFYYEAKMPEKFGSDIIMSCCNLINNSSILRDFSLKFDMYHLSEWDQQKSQHVLM